MKKAIQFFIGMLVLSGGMLISGFDGATAKASHKHFTGLDYEIQDVMKQEVRF